jgi:hypothetical protein
LTRQPGWLNFFETFDSATLTKERRQRVQAYLEPELAEVIRKRAEDGHRPESWELERLIRLGLQASSVQEGSKSPS